MMIRLFRVSIPSSVLALVLTDAVLVFSCYVVAAYLGAVDISVDIFLLNDGGWWRILLVTVPIILGLYFSDLYENYRIRSRTVLMQQFSLVIGVAFILQSFLSSSGFDLNLPKWMMVYGSLLVMVVVPAWRILFVKAVWKAMGAQRLLFVGTSGASRDVMQSIMERPELGMAPLGFLDRPDAPAVEKVNRLGGLEDLKSVVLQYNPDRIVVGVSERRGQLPIHALLELRLAGMRVEEAATIYETVFSRVATEELRPAQLVFSADLGPRRGMVNLQSIYSWVIGLAGFVIAVPIMLLTALLVKVTSPGPILYRQTRLGRHGRPFVLYKFRSMYQNAEAATGAVWATRDDPRATPLGRWLRLLRLDELPQLINVIRGEMSLVGPRPERPEFVQVLEEKIPYYRHRLYVKPGITGWAQINHKYGDTIEDTIIKLEFDLFYIKNISPALDFYILFHTVKTVLLGRGAQ